jgi:N-acyl-D-aspartate/D-glutamate deacylase
MLAHKGTVLGLGDGGAHYGMICDAAYPTFLLTHWVRDAAPGRGFDLPAAVSMLTREPAETVGLLDRGLLLPGYRANINVIDFDRLKLHAPHIHADLPAGGKRLHQYADGYDATIVAGCITYRGGASTGELAGRLIRGSKSDPGLLWHLPNR